MWESIVSTSGEFATMFSSDGGVEVWLDVAALPTRKGSRKRRPIRKVKDPAGLLIIEEYLFSRSAVLIAKRFPGQSAIVSDQIVLFFFQALIRLIQYFE